MKDPAAIRKTLENVLAIPTLPIVIEKITRLLQNPSTSAEEIGKAITTDQALASKVLKLVNSAFYGFPGKISTVTHAVVILGFATVKNVVLTASIFDSFSKRVSLSRDFDLQKFWLHSVACGAASQCIARHIGFNAKEECFIAGLIHDLGKIIMCNYLPDEFEMVLADRIRKDCLFFESENDVLHITHQELGGIIAERWNLPSALQNAVKNHHYQSPDKEFSTVTGIVHAADIFVRALDIGNGGDDKIPQMSAEIWNNLGFEGLQLQALLEDIESEVDKATVFMQLV